GVAADAGARLERRAREGLGEAEPSGGGGTELVREPVPVRGDRAPGSSGLEPGAAEILPDRPAAAMRGEPALAGRRRGLALPGPVRDARPPDRHVAVVRGQPCR